jgi:hypothetical protein
MFSINKVSSKKGIRSSTAAGRIKITEREIKQEFTGEYFATLTSYKKATVPSFFVTMAVLDTTMAAWHITMAG